MTIHIGENNKKKREKIILNKVYSKEEHDDYSLPILL
jgi:hypothetical protein